MNNNHPDTWKFTSNNKPGMNTILSPEKSNSKNTWIFRLNLLKDQTYHLIDNLLELNAIVIRGHIKITHNSEPLKLNELDSFYLPSKQEVKIEANKNTVLYIGGGPCEGIGRFYVREYNPDLKDGNIVQVHGKAPYRRDVFMTLNQEVPASRLICGITRGEDGGWTSWPPHQHSKELEEAYFYFDIPEPYQVLQLLSRHPGKVESINLVGSGDCIFIPEGYHPTIAMPGSKSCYFWVMVARSRKLRRYDLAVNDPSFD